MKIKSPHWLVTSIWLVVVCATIWSYCRHISTPSREAMVEEKVEEITTNLVAVTSVTTNDGTITVTGSVKPTFSDKIK